MQCTPPLLLMLLYRIVSHMSIALNELSDDKAHCWKGMRGLIVDKDKHRTLEVNTGFSRAEAGVYGIQSFQISCLTSRVFVNLLPSRRLVLVPTRSMVALRSRNQS